MTLARVEAPAERLPPLQLLRTVVRNPIEAWPASVYTESIVRSRFLGRDTAFLMHPDLVRGVLVEHAEAFEKAEAMRRALDPALGQAILTAEGARWRWQRRAAAPIFRHDRILSFVPVMTRVTEETVRSWLGKPDGTEINVAHEMMRTTFDIIADTMLSGRSGLDVGAIEQAITAFLETTSWPVMLTMLRAPRWVPYPGRKRARAGRLHLREAVSRIVDERRNANSSADDLLALLLAASDAETGQSMDQRDVVNNLLTFILAGHETTALALTWTFYLLSQHPEVEAAVIDEIASVIGEGSTEASHIDALVLTREVIQESMRLYPPAPVVVRRAVRDVDLGGERIAAGTEILIPIYAIHRHATLWDEPDRFDPRRFRPEAVKARDRYTYLPFGAGPRICIGMSFAMIEAVVILVTLLRAVRLELRPGYVPALKQRITLRPREGMPMRLFRREGFPQAASSPAASASA